MPLNIGLIGCGNWSKVVKKEIENSEHFNLNSVVCRDNNINFSQNFKIFKNINDIFNYNHIDCLYVAAIPNINLDIIRLAITKKLPLILEKPLSNSYISSIEIKKIYKKNKIIVLPNLTHFFSGTYKEIEKFIFVNKSEIIKIIINEGNFGPFRDKINPIWDWGFHSISLIHNLFLKDNISNVKNKEIQSSSLYGNGVVTKFSFDINNKIKTKILTGNLFTKKNRVIKIILNNGNYLKCDLINHHIYINDKLIYKNSVTPINSMLTTFYNLIKKNNYNYCDNLIETSCRTINMLEKFYKC